MEANSRSDLVHIARHIRGEVVQMSHLAKAPHLGSALSCVDILTVAYWRVLRIDPDQPQLESRDRFILSKGHAASALYAALAYRGYFPKSDLALYGLAGSHLPEQPCPNTVPGVEVATGSLGHGLSVGIGIALAARIRKLNYRVMVVVSDGECNEGSVWEAAMFAAAQKLDNLVVVVDFNKWQATGRSEEVLALQPLADKWRAFGWETVELDGHNLEQLEQALSPPRVRPFAVVAHTIKGKGVSFMEDDNNWHYRVPSEVEVKSAWLELGLT